MTKWHEKDGGYASGPVQTVKAGPALVRVQAVWTDTDGVCLSIDPGEEPVPAAEVAKVCAALLTLSELDGPR